MIFDPTNAPIVIDNGTGMLKVGYAGEMQPRLVVPMILGRPKHMRILLENHNEYFIGNYMECKRGALTLSYPIVNGTINNWDDLKTVWEHVFNNELHINTENHPILVSDTPLNPKNHREKMIELLFDYFKVPATYISLQSVLSLYACGRTTGLILDSGEGVTHIVPIYDSYVIPTNIHRRNLAGRDITNYLKILLTERGYKFLNSTCEHEIVRDIKENVCYITTDFDSALCHNNNHNNNKSNHNNCDNYSKCRNSQETIYRLPDGQLVHIGNERYRAPELLFNPKLGGYEYSGLHNTINHIINMCDMDLRKSFWSNIILAGGSTMFPGFVERLNKELNHLVPCGANLKIHASPERKYSVWIGGAVLASLSTFSNMWITKQEYDEYGSNIVHQKCV